MYSINQSIIQSLTHSHSVFDAPATEAFASFALEKFSSKTM